MRRIVTAREQVQMCAPWRTAAYQPHPDLEEQRRRHGTVHTAHGRVLPGWRLALLDPSGQEARLDPAHPAWSHHVSFTPSGLAVAGAQAYNSTYGLGDTHTRSFENIRQTPERIRTVGRNYDSLPAHNPAATPHYEAMRTEVNRQHDFLTNRLGISTPTVDHDPYSDVHEMLADVNNNKQLKVLSTATTGGHPYFSDAENDKLRAVHDFFGHAATGRSFDRHGEHAAWLAHSQMFSPQAHPALGTDLAGQNSSLILNGGFPQQKIGLLHPDIMRSLQKWARRGYSSVIVAFQEEFGKALMKSLHDTGGFSFRDPRQALADAPTGGYMVSQTPDYHVPAEKFSPDHALDFWQQHQPHLDAHPDHYVGGWLEDGNVYLELSKNHTDYHNAIADSYGSDQIALRDLGHSTDIDTAATHYKGDPGIWMAGRR